MPKMYYKIINDRYMARNKQGDNEIPKWSRHLLPHVTFNPKQTTSSGHIYKLKTIF